MMDGADPRFDAARLLDGVPDDQLAAVSAEFDRFALAEVVRLMGGDLEPPPTSTAGAWEVREIAAWFEVDPALLDAGAVLAVPVITALRGAPWEDCQ